MGEIFKAPYSFKDRIKDLGVVSLLLFVVYPFCSGVVFLNWLERKVVYPLADCLSHHNGKQAKYVKKRLEFLEGERLNYLTRNFRQMPVSEALSSLESLPSLPKLYRFLLDKQRILHKRLIGLYTAMGNDSMTDFHGSRAKDLEAYLDRP